MDLNEKSPPGFEGTVKAMKKHKDIDNPWALSWWMKNKGYKSHKKKDGSEKSESFRAWLENLPQPPAGQPQQPQQPEDDWFTRQMPKVGQSGRLG